MTEESKFALRGNKCARIILALVKMFGLSPEKAADIFYTSETSAMIEEGIADLQCRSDNYLATLIWEEYNNA
jgi:hypothetical protein